LLVRDGRSFLACAKLERLVALDQPPGERSVDEGARLAAAGARESARAKAPCG